VMVPIFKDDNQLQLISEKALTIKRNLELEGISVHFDDRDTYKPGWKFAEYELKGVPVRLAIGPRDIESDTVELARRDTGVKEVCPIEGIEEKIAVILEEMQQSIYDKALAFRESNTTPVETYDQFKEVLDNKGGFVLAHWDGTAVTEERIKEETKATIRCIPLSGSQEAGDCIYSGKPSKQRVVFARAY